MYGPSAEGDAPEAGAPEDEIEVTPEMIAAGRAILYSYDDRFSNENDVVEGIYRAMVAELRKDARRGGLCGQS